MGYARYQYVINEMLSPSRIGNRHANELLLGNCEAISSGKCDSNPCGCVRRFFYQMHKWVRTGRTGTNLEFCNYILDVPGTVNPCKSKPMQRRFHMNLAALSRYGTVEFRTHSGTYDEERMARWLQFTVAFVEHFGRAGGDRTGMSQFFNSSSSDLDYKKLQRAQYYATRAELFKQLEGKVASDSEDYYKFRRFEQIRDSEGYLVEDPTCHIPGEPLVVKPAGPPVCGGVVDDSRRRQSVQVGCCKWGGNCGDCGDDGSGWCHKSASNCQSCTGSFDAGARAPVCQR